MTTHKAPKVPTGSTGGALPNDLKRYHLTEFGNTERLYDTHGEDIRYFPGFGFVVWSGTHWLINEEHTVKQWATDVVLSMYEDASKLLESASKNGEQAVRDSLSKEASRLIDWCRQSENSRMISGVISLLSSKRGVYLRNDTGKATPFDVDPFLINFPNGTLDIRTGKLREHRREDYLTACTPYPYVPGSPCPAFLKFLDEIMLGKQDIVNFLQCFLGYALTGDTREHAWLQSVGGGSNGKSTLLDAVAGAVGGDYCTTISDKTITVSNRDGGAASPDIAALRGKRLLIVSETEPGARVATQLIKRIASGDMEYARFLHQDGFTFKHSGKLFVATNHELRVGDNSNAFWRRIHYIPFDRTFSEEVKDKMLPARLQAEYTGVLAWLVEGALAWYRDGLTVPDTVKQATESYREEQDTLQQFLRECCVVLPALSVSAKSLIKVYASWAETLGIKVPDGRTFARQMKEKGYAGKRYNKGVIYHGLGLQEETSPTESPSTNGHKPLTEELADLDML